VLPMRGQECVNEKSKPEDLRLFAFGNICKLVMPVKHRP